MATNSGPGTHQTPDEGRRVPAAVDEPLYLFRTHAAFLLGCAATNAKVAEALNVDSFANTWQLRELAKAVLGKDREALANLLLEGGQPDEDGIILTLVRKHMACFERRKTILKATETITKARKGEKGTGS